MPSVRPSSLVRLLLLVVISAILAPFSAGLTCNSCRQKKRGDGERALLPPYSEDYYNSDCTANYDRPDPEESHTQNCDELPGRPEACQTIHIKACRNGALYEEKIRRCGVPNKEQDPYLCPDITDSEDIDAISDGSLKLVAAKLCTCHDDRCNNDRTLQDYRSDPGDPDCTKKALVQCYACVERITGADEKVEAGLLACGSATYDFNWNTRSCEGGCQILHIKSCNKGEPYEVKLRGCKDFKFFKKQGSYASSGYSYSSSRGCGGVGDKIARRFGRLKNVAAQVCQCSGDRCNGAELTADPGERGGTCREEPESSPKPKCDSGGGGVFSSGWVMGVLGAILVM